MASKRKPAKSRVTPAVYFSSLSVENVRCFGAKQTLDLTDSKGNPARWTVILGDNGVGKTTLLQCLAATQPPWRERGQPEGLVWTKPSPAGFPEWIPFRGQGEVPAEVDAECAVGSRLELARKQYRICKVSWSRDNLGGRAPGEPPFGQSWPNAAASIFGYGAARRVPEIRTPGRAVSFPTESLFDNGVELSDPENWLLKADYTAQRSKRIKNRAEAHVEKIKEILIRLLPDVSDIRISEPRTTADRPRAEAKTPFGWGPLSDLSLGYKTLIAWVTDLAIRLFELHPSADDPLSEPAIVLVDEIDLHLHPRWQRTILDYLSARFVNTQFIVTAHSPLVVQSAEGANIAVLRREGDQVVIDNDIEAIRGWRVDQVLTSDLFGLETARPASMEPLLRERKKLLTKPRLRKADKARLRTLEQQIGELPAGDTPEDGRAMNIIRRAARRLEQSGD